MITVKWDCFMDFFTFLFNHCSVQDTKTHRPISATRFCQGLSRCTCPITAGTLHLPNVTQHLLLFEFTGRQLANISQNTVWQYPEITQALVHNWKSIVITSTYNEEPFKHHLTQIVHPLQIFYAL